MAKNIPGGGKPGVDYPILSKVPVTGFSCSDYAYSGYFADVSPQARCQVFHYCHTDGGHSAFLCPNGTIFNQQNFVCDRWFKVDCAASSVKFDLNMDIGKIPETRKEAKTTNSYSDIREDRKQKEFHESLKAYSQLHHILEASRKIKEAVKPEQLYKTPIQEPKPLHVAPVEEPEQLYKTPVKVPVEEPEQLYKTPVQEPVEEPEQLYKTPVKVTIEEPEQLYKTPVEEPVEEP